MATTLVLRQILLVFLKQLRVDIVLAAAFRRIAGDISKRAFGITTRAGVRRLVRLKQILAVGTFPFGYL